MDIIRGLQYIGRGIVSTFVAVGEFCGHVVQWWNGETKPVAKELANPTVDTDQYKSLSNRTVENTVTTRTAAAVKRINEKQKRLQLKMDELVVKYMEYGLYVKYSTYDDELTEPFKTQARKWNSLINDNLKSINEWIGETARNCELMDEKSVQDALFAVKNLKIITGRKYGQDTELKELKATQDKCGRLEEILNDRLKSIATNPVSIEEQKPLQKTIENLIAEYDGVLNQSNKNQVSWCIPIWGKDSEAKKNIQQWLQETEANLSSMNKESAQVALNTIFKLHSFFQVSQGAHKYMLEPYGQGKSTIPIEDIQEMDAGGKQLAESLINRLRQ